MTSNSVDASKEAFYGSLSDKEVVDTLLLPCLMFHGVKSLQKKGIEFREDILVYLERSFDAVLSKINEVPLRIKYADEANKVSKRILDDMNPDNEVQAIKAAAMMIVLMAEQEMIVDTGSQAVLAAMLITHQAQ